MQYDDSQWSYAPLSDRASRTGEAADIDYSAPDLSRELTEAASYYPHGRSYRLSPGHRRGIQERRVDFLGREENRPSFEPPVKRARRVSFLDQFFAVVERVMRQCLRMKMSLLLEVLVPVVFILITVIIWSLWGTDHMQDTNFVDYDALQTAIDAAFYKKYACSSIEDGVPGIPVCSLEEDIDCEGDESTIPVKGLCVYASVGITKLVNTFVNSFNGRVAQLPSLDSLIFFQWLARKGSTLDASPFGAYPSTRYSAIMASGHLYFVGEQYVITRLTKFLNSTYTYFHYVNGGTFDTVEDARKEMSNNEFNWGIVHLRRFNADGLDAIIYLHSDALPALDEIVATAYPGGFQFDRAEMYVVSGYLTLQSIVSEYYINEFYPKLKLVTSPFIASQPYVEYRQTPLLMYARDILPLIFALAFLYPFTSRTKAVVLEKEMRIREAMLIMGVRDPVLYVTWFVRSIFLDFTVCLIITIIFKCTFISQSDPFTIFFVFFLFTLTIITLSGLVSSFLSKARLASLLSPIIYFIFTIPNLASTKTNDTLTIVFALLSPSCLVTLLQRILEEEVTRGFNAGTFSKDTYTLRTSVLLGMMGADFFIYGILMVYLDAVLPRDWGTPKHPLFFIIDPIRWYLSRENHDDDFGEDGRAPDGAFEDDEDEDEDEERNAVQIVGLRKVYRRSGKKFTAVNNLYWTMREGEISVLLGHNGAGKSTTLNMMTGMVRPDGGDCYVYRMSVRHDLSRVRQEIGFCPQHNILWPELTCREHLEFFGKIKGLKGAELENAVQDMLNETDLLDKEDFSSRRLSGGQKRKLSVAVAFVGQSRLVFLDEPTAGMDVAARRYTWELLRRMSSSHTILLTTHYMDEADLLGHRIGIMSNGSLQCSGSSLFLKSRLGLGYSFLIAMHPDGDFRLIHDLVLYHVSEAEIISRNGLGVLYRLPLGKEDDFPQLLDDVESRAECGVRGYSISATSLEDVFLRVSGQAEDEELVNADYSYLWSFDLTNSPLWCQFRCMMKKRMLNALLDRRMQCFQLGCPFLCVLLAMLLGLVNSKANSEINLSFDLYKKKTLMDTAQCNDFWGPNASASGVFINETHYANAAELGDYAIDTWFTHAMPRYASISCIDRDLYYLTGAQNPVIMLHNTSALHQVAITMSVFYELLLRNITEGSGSISWSVGSLSGPSEDKGILSMILTGAIIMIPFTFLPSNPVAWIVKERECGALHLQRIAGLRFTIYWLSNFLFDFAAYIATVILVIIIFLIFGRKEYVGPETAGAMISLLLVYGLTSTPAGYLISFFFNEHSTAQMVVMAGGFATGFLMLMIVFVLSILDKTKDTSDNLRWPFRLVPTYSIGEGILNLGNYEQMKSRGQVNSAFDGNMTGYPILFLAAEFPVFVILVLLVDHPKRRALWGRYLASRQPDSPYAEDEDTDVEDERNAVYKAREQLIDEGVVTLCDLRKTYSNGKVAVNNLTFSILPGEVFGFLGTNGAGKTTTISILCQEFLPTYGTASVCGYDVVHESSEALQCIGYCPQFDACLDLLTVEEHLYLYAGIRGIVESQREVVVDGLMGMCGLTEYRKTRASELSGGNRRKLSVATALVGGPRVVFFDEPSAGMDPVARRGLWTTIQKASSYCSVVLTTHHLEEVEALADVVAIMVDGKLRCIGDKVHLKNKFGSGYEVSIRIGDESLYERVESFVRCTFPNAVLNEFKGQRFVYALPPDTCLSDTFRILQQNKELLGITDYSVSQTSIEQVFLRVSEETERRHEDEAMWLVEGKKNSFYCPCSFCCGIPTSCC